MVEGGSSSSTFTPPLPIRKCLQALALQNFPRDRDEIVVVDDGSTPPIDVQELSSSMKLTVLPAGESRTVGGAQRRRPAKRAESIMYFSMTIVAWLQAGSARWRTPSKGVSRGAFSQFSAPGASDARFRFAEHGASKPQELDFGAFESPRRDPSKGRKKFGANGEGRTPMALRPLEPKSSASASSATFAHGLLAL